MASKSSEPREDVHPKTRSSEIKKQSKEKGAKYLEVPPNAFKPFDNRRPPPGQEQSTNDETETKTEKRPTISKHKTGKNSDSTSSSHVTASAATPVAETGATHSVVKQWMLSRFEPKDPLPADSFVSWSVERPVLLHTGDGSRSEKPVTVMTMLQESVATYATKTALSSRIGNKWVGVTYEAFLENVLQTARGFIKLGLQRFRGVGILASDSVESVVSYFGAIFAGGISCPLYVNNPPDICFELLRDVGCQVLVVDSTDLREHVLKWIQRLSDFRAIVQIDTISLRSGDNMHSWNEFIEMGRGVPIETVIDRVSLQAPNLCCCVVQTAGTCGKPKNVMLSHDNLVWSGKILGRSCCVASGEEVSALVPHPNGSTGCLNLLFMLLTYGANVHLFSATDVPSLLMAMKEIRPTILAANARFYERFEVQIEEHFRRNLFRRLLFRWAKGVGEKRVLDNLTLSSSRPFCWSVANCLVYKNIRARAGLDRCREFYSGGYSLLPNALRFFQAIDMCVQVVYGMAETTGATTMATPERYKIGSVGFPISGCSLTVADPDKNDIGKIRIADGRNIAMGYLDAKQLTESSFEKSSGTLQTNDLGRREEDGRIFIVGDSCGKLTLSTGDKIMALPLQLKIRAHLPFVNHVLLIGEGRPYLSALLSIAVEVDPKTQVHTSTLAQQGVRWFAQNGFQFTSSTEIDVKGGWKLSKKIQTVFDTINAEAPHESHRIVRWMIMPHPFTTETQELGPTMRIRRWFITQKYSAAIALLYPSHERRSSAAKASPS